MIWQTHLFPVNRGLCIILCEWTEYLGIRFDDDFRCHFPVVCKQADYGALLWLVSKAAEISRWPLTARWGFNNVWSLPPSSLCYLSPSTVLVIAWHICVYEQQHIHWGEQCDNSSNAACKSVIQGGKHVTFLGKVSLFFVKYYPSPFPDSKLVATDIRMYSYRNKGIVFWRRAVWFVIDNNDGSRCGQHLATPYPTVDPQRLHGGETCIEFSYLYRYLCLSLQWRHNGRGGVPNHQPHDCLLNRLFRRRSKKTSKLRVTGLC